MGQIFVAFSEYMNFKVLGLSRDLLIKMVFGAKAQHRGSLGWGAAELETKKIYMRGYAIED